MQPAINGFKDVLSLNRTFLLGVIAWAFILAYVALAKSIQTESTCGALNVLAIFGLTLGGMVSLADSILEICQDLAYTGCGKDLCCLTLIHDNEYLRADMSVKPADYGGVQYNGICCKMCTCLSNDPKKDAAGQDRANTPSEGTKRWNRRCACCFLTIETIARFLGNIALFWFFVLGTLNPSQWQPGNKTHTGCDGNIPEPLSWWYDATMIDANPFLIIVLGINFVRVLIYIQYVKSKKAKTYVDPMKQLVILLDGDEKEVEVGDAAADRIRAKKPAAQPVVIVQPPAPQPAGHPQPQPVVIVQPPGQAVPVQQVGPPAVN